ncbi:hypothetical protein [Streptomyces sp. NPDC020489]|uniref:hypothetical protein n=1 Tax=Streptomyces sp. NPDC020489 TaxID=3365077 RepID=UPI0037B24588
MTQAQAETSSGTRRWAGVVADGVVKVLLGASFSAGAAPLGDLLGVPTWLMIVAGVVLLIGGGIEIRYVRRRPLPTYRRLMVAYDGGWVLAMLAGLLVAWQGGTAGGEVWIGYQAVAPLALAAMLMAAAPAPSATDTRAENSTP